MIHTARHSRAAWKVHIVAALLLLLSVVAIPSRLPAAEPAEAANAVDLSMFARDKLVAWCIVPFDAKKRGPEARAAMLEKLGIKHFAYDYRAEHIATFDEEMEALKRHDVSLDAWWFPGELNDEARLILDVLKRHNIKAQLWISGGGEPTKSPEEQQQRVAAEAARIRPVAEAAAAIGCQVGLYNHGGWFGEPENQIAIIKQLNLDNVGIVYNQHHGHDHIDRFAELLQTIKPHLLMLNLNGTVRDGDKKGQKILPIGAGDLDLGLLKIIRDSGYHGPIGILNHTDLDAETRLLDNIDGLEWLLPQLEGKPAPALPQYRTHTPANPVPQANNDATDQQEAFAYNPELVSQVVSEAQTAGDAQRGADVFSSAKFACVSCHKVGEVGGTVGPELSKVGVDLKPHEIVESVLWPKRHVKPQFTMHEIATADGQLVKGYLVEETAEQITLKDPASGEVVQLAKADIDERQEAGTLMPGGLAEAMSIEQRRDLVRLLLDLGSKEGLAVKVMAPHGHAAASFPYDNAPLNPRQWTNASHRVNRDRVYDFYSKEANYFSTQATLPGLLPEFPGLDSGRDGHWGNQNEDTWMDARWNQTELGTVMGGVFRAAKVTVPKGVCVRLGDKGELAACFNPETLNYDAVWQGGFVKFSAVRHGFVDGLVPVGDLLPTPPRIKQEKPFIFHGYYRHGPRVVFCYSIDGVRYLDAPWCVDGKFTRQVAPVSKHPLAHLTKGGPTQWPQELAVPGILGEPAYEGAPYVLDTIVPPTDNPWKALMFFGDHDFLPDGSALICTMQGDVWHVTGLDDTLEHVKWRRFAAGLHHALGLVVHDGQAYVLCRDQITRLEDINGDGEADYYDCFSNVFTTSPAGHDFICGLQRDAAGNFYTASGNQGILRIAADGRQVEVLASGFRNPDGLGLLPNGRLTVPCSEGEWTPASMICEVKRATTPPSPPAAIGGHQPPYFGYGGPRNEQAPDLPLVYLPRGMDNSSGGQVYIDSDRWGPLKGQMVHLSFGAGSQFLLLRDEVANQPQGAIVPLPGDFVSGAHRGRFNRADGQLYVSGMAGWGSYTAADGCFQRSRYTGQPAQLPIKWRAHENGVLVTFAQPVDSTIAAEARSHFAQVWNYRYSGGYGSQEFSTLHPGIRGHDPLVVSSVHILPDQHQLFLEIPELQPVNMLHLQMHVNVHGKPQELFATVHQLAPPFTDFAGYQPISKTIAAHPILVDLATAAKALPNPWLHPLAGAREMTIEAGKNLTFATRTLKARAGEPLKITFINPDVVPHNWVLVQPGSLKVVGELANRLVADPEAVIRQYVPESDKVVVYSDIVQSQDRFSINFRAPEKPGRYPYLCTFPGHWMVMNGELIVE